jgi:diguanylate cyclase (GGDEF)-like protein
MGAMKGPEPTGLFLSVREPMTWTSVDRCFVMACLFIVTSIPFIVSVGLGRSDIDMLKLHDADVALAFQRAAITVDVVWLAVAAIAVAIRRRTRRSAALEHFTVQLIAVSLSVASWTMGLVTTPFALALLGALIVGLLLFRRRTVLLGALTSAVLLVGASMGTLLGRVRYAPLYRDIPIQDGHIATWWHVEMLLVVVITIALVIGIFLYVLARLRDREANLEKLSKLDPLTGALNRREFVATFERELARSNRYGQPLSVVIVDIDHFKSINDRHGHLAGDAVLTAASAMLQQELRTEDSLARYGGEEFVVLLPSTEGDGARAVAERCRTRLASTPIIADGASVSLTASFGVASRAAGDPARAETLLRVADDALYRAKKGGRNRVVAA